MKRIITLLCMLSLFFTYGQNTVPPVKKSKGTMKITPDPNKKTGNGKTRTNTNTTTSGNLNAITLIVDYSGSMQGAPLNAAKNSSLIIVDLIELWGKKIFQKQLGNINFQYIEFGGTSESNIVHTLGKISNAKSLRRKISSSLTNFGGTDFSSGINEALQQLNGKGLNNKTIFLTDAGDGGNGPSTTQGYYKDLVDTKFVIYNSPNASVSQKGWLNAVPNGSEFHVASEYEVLSLFVKTLFEFVDDINYHLVRQGTMRIDSGKPFSLFKHTNDKENLLVLSKPQGANLEIEKIIDPSGKILSNNSYTLDDTKTFFNIILKDALPSGNYKIFFKNVNRSHDLFYINFEKCNIYLKLETSPAISSSKCFVENSAVNFNFKYVDADIDKEIKYPDFLSHAAYHYKIENNILDKTGKGTTGLSFSQSFPVGSAGSYEVWSAWSYNEKKMRLHNKPSLALLSNFCINKQGYLVGLDYDTLQTWEGRQIVFKAKIQNQSSNVANTIKKLYLNTGHQIIELKQDTNQKNVYEGILDEVKGDTQYSLTLENRNSTYNFAFDKNAKTSFLGKKRELLVTYKGKDYDAYKQKNTSDFFNKVKYIFSSKKIPVKEYQFTGQDIIIPYQLPYYDSVQDSVEFSFKLNKIFPDEEVLLRFQSDSITYTYPQKKVAKNGLWGVFSTESDYDDAVTVHLGLKDSLKIKNGSAFQTSIIKKKKGEMFFDKPLYEAPKFSTNGIIRFLINNKERVIPIDTTNIQLDIVTSPVNKFYVITKWTVYWTLSIIIIVLLLLIYSILYIVSKKKCNQKIKLWRRLNDSDLSKIEDLWSEPVKQHKCNQKLELPELIKNAFKNENNRPSKNAFIIWNISDISNNNKEIKKRICYRSLFYKSNILGKSLYILFFPIAMLIDLSRSAFELDKSIITNKKFLKYVQHIENAGEANIPSEWSFTNTNRILITFNDHADNAVRLRHISYHSKIAEIVLSETSITLVAVNASLEVTTSKGDTEFLTIGKRYTSQTQIDEIRFIVNDEILFTVENIDYESSSCNIKTHLMNHQNENL